MGLERLRLVQQVGRKEQILVLFAGCGCEALQIAVKTEGTVPWAYLPTLATWPSTVSNPAHAHTTEDPALACLLNAVRQKPHKKKSQVRLLLLLEQKSHLGPCAFFLRSDIDIFTSIYIYIVIHL
jgi:hypothetical protein